MSKLRGPKYFGAQTIGREIPEFDGLVNFCREGLVDVFSAELQGRRDRLTFLNQQLGDKALEIGNAKYASGSLATAALTAALGIIPAEVMRGPAHE